MFGSTDLPLRPWLRWALTFGAVLAACGPDASAPAANGAIDRETFIATYVDLRAVTIRGDSFALSDAQRAEVLARHGVAEGDLLAFVEAHGEDVPFMRAVWDEVEARLDAERVLPADSAAAAPPTHSTGEADPSPSRRPRMR